MTAPSLSRLGIETGIPFRAVTVRERSFSTLKHPPDQTKTGGRSSQSAKSLQRFSPMF